MYIKNNNHFQFVKNTKLITVLVFLTFYGTRWNGVNAAVVTKPVVITVPEESCEKTCDTPICHAEAHTLKTKIDESIDPCDDFYNFACGKIINSPAIQVNESDTSGQFDTVQKLIDKQIRSKVNTINSNDPESFIKMHTFYRNCLNQAEEGIGSILRVLKNIGGSPLLLGDKWNETAYDWKEALYKIIDEKIFIPFPVYIRPVRQDSDLSKIILEVSTVETGDKRVWRNVVNESFIALGANSKRAEIEVDELYNFQLELHKIKSTSEELLNQSINETQVPIGVLEHNYPSIPWLKLFNKILNPSGFYLNSRDVVRVKDRKFITNLAFVLDKTPKRVIANFLAWSVVSTVLPSLPKPFHQLCQKYGLDRTKSRKDFCITQLNEYFVFALDSLYVRRIVAPKFLEEMKKDVESIVDYVKNQVKTNLQNVEWMDTKTKAAALKKINSMHKLVSYSKELLDDSKINQYYSQLTITPGSFFKNSINASAFILSKQFSTLKELPDKLSWFFRGSAREFNAAYSYPKNAIDIPAAFLQSFMYSYGRPHYLNFGALGSIIGHEITHGFDNRGRNYDENGLLNNWWFHGTERKYLQKAQCLIDQFNNYTIPKTNLKVDGEKTQNENIADNGGFRAAYHAYNKYIEDSGISEGCLPGMNYTTKQMFWLSLATMWCSKDGVDYIRNLINKDPHPPHYARVILSYSNMKEFADDFKCKAGSRMNPEKKCTMW